MYQLARLLHFRNGKGTEELFAVTPRLYHARGFQNSDVLRHVGLRNFQTLLEVADNPFATAKQVKHLEANRVREGFADSRLPFEDLAIEFAVIAAFFHFEIIKLRCW